MMATFNCAPLKNSGFRSIGMSCVALLVVIDPNPVGVKRSLFFGDPASSVTPGGQNMLPPGHRADVTEASKYSRFRSNKKTCAAILCYGLFTGGCCRKRDGGR